MTSRIEIADHVADAFENGPATPDDLLAAAINNRAPTPVIDQLQRLPRREYRHLRDLWPELPGVPVEV